LINHRMEKFGRTMIVVLDDSRARFLRREDAGRFAEAMADVSAGSDRKGDGASADRMHRRREFLQSVMAKLDEACDGSACDRIIAVGPERMLSAFRKAASDKVRVRLWRETAAELNDLNDSELEKRLAPHFR
jgi:protein required for attachment to host cells